MFYVSFIVLLFVLLLLYVLLFILVFLVLLLVIVVIKRVINLPEMMDCKLLISFLAIYRLVSMYAITVKLI